MKRPSFQFYPADWRNNAKLRRCSEAARGAWIDVLCLLHDFDEYGVCRWPLAELARAAGIPIKLAKELVAKDVLKGADKAAPDYIFTPTHAGKSGDPVTLLKAGEGPCWYCSRLVRDEYIRQRRGSGSRFTSDNQPPPMVGHHKDSKSEPNSKPKQSPKGGIGERQGDGPTSTSTSSLKAIPPIPPKGGDARRRNAVVIQTFLAECKEKGENPIPDDDPVLKYCTEAGIPQEFLALQWKEFKERHRDGDKRYKDWRKAFRNSVRGNWYHLWAINGSGEYFLTTNGKQAERINQEAA